MTEEQKEILIAKMLDAPSSLSGEELDLIVKDDELRDIYNASAAISTACIRHPELDMEEEWNIFRPRIRHKPSMVRWVMRIAAIFLGVLFASGVVVEIIDSKFAYDPQPVIAKVEQSPKTDSKPAVRQDTRVAESEKEESEIKQKIVRKHSSTYTPHTAKANTSQSGSVSQVESEIEIDVDEFLRIQQARIDNDLAMQVAESHMEEYDDLVALLDAVGSHKQELENMIKKVTME